MAEIYNDKFTFLTTRQLQTIEVLKAAGAASELTDFAILLGAWTQVVPNGNKFGNYWTSSFDNNKIYIFKYLGNITISVDVRTRNCSCRPIILKPNNKDGIVQISDNNGMIEVEYNGYEYPQTAASLAMNVYLDSKYSTGSLKQTGKTYTIDSIPSNDKTTDFTPETVIEYEYLGERYVRVKANSNYGSNDEFQLSDNWKHRNGDYIWLKVEPIRWLLDKKTGILISKKLLFAGIRFASEEKQIGLDNSEVGTFMSTYFANEILPQGSVVLKENVNTKETTPVKQTLKPKKQNPYDFVFNNVSEEDIIRGAVESGVAVFLHGKSSEGKSARVKQIDPDCEIIYLRNATPESLNGKSVYKSETGEMIDIEPTWLKRIKKICEEEPNKIHIVFFDEITNALPSIQGMAFNIVLSREVNGIWKLPDNCRIVAAGNDIEDSIAANQLAEPLYNRFAHVYIETTVESWLKWAATIDGTKEKVKYEGVDNPVKEYTIHPAVYAFISYRRDAALRSKYTGEKPNADPRKWELASRMLYKTKNPNMLRSLIGEPITREFCTFCKQQVITLQNVIEGNYTDEEISKMNTSEKHAVTSSLLCVDEENVEKVREFVLKLGSEFASIFDSFWTQNIERRLEIMAELRSTQSKVSPISKPEVTTRLRVAQPKASVLSEYPTSTPYVMDDGIYRDDHRLFPFTNFPDDDPDDEKRVLTIK